MHSIRGKKKDKKERGLKWVRIYISKCVVMTNELDDCLIVIDSYVYQCIVQESSEAVGWGNINLIS